MSFLVYSGINLVVPFGVKRYVREKLQKQTPHYF